MFYVIVEPRGPGRYSMREQLVHHIANYVLDRVIGPAPLAILGGVGGDLRLAQAPARRRPSRRLRLS
jgi:hypothetical protein